MQSKFRKYKTICSLNVSFNIFTKVCGNLAYFQPYSASTAILGIVLPKTDGRIE
jgi:hypothetical protein